MKKTVPNPQTGKKFPAAKPPDPAPAGKKETACQGQNPQTKNAGVNRKNTGEKTGRPIIIIIIIIIYLRIIKKIIIIIMTIIQKRSGKATG